MVNLSGLDGYLKSRLHSRMIPFESYTFADGSAAVIVMLRTSSFSISIPYIIHYVDEKYRLVTPESQYDENTLNGAVSKLVIDMRKMEVRFSKWKR